MHGPFKSLFSASFLISFGDNTGKKKRMFAKPLCLPGATCT